MVNNFFGSEYRSIGSQSVHRSISNGRSVKVLSVAVLLGLAAPSTFAQIERDGVSKTVVKQAEARDAGRVGPLDQLEELSSFVLRTELGQEGRSEALARLNEKLCDPSK